MNREQANAAQDKYVEAKIAGATQEEAKELAGYSPGSSATVLEKKGGAIAEKLAKALEERGLDEKFLAKEYEEGIAAAKQPGARDKDLNAYAQLLKQLGFLMGHGKRETPQVAVQINNGVGGSGDEPAATRDLIAEVAALVEVLAGQVGKDQQRGFHDGDSRPSDPEAHPRVVEPVVEAPSPRGGSGA